MAQKDASDEWQLRKIKLVKNSDSSSTQPLMLYYSPLKHTD